MYTKRVYRIRDMALWTRIETFLFLGIGAAWAAIYYFLDLTWIQIPWTPVALIGTAVAFVIGFQNNAAYGRIWEARKIWGGIVNTSRTFGMYIQDMITNEHATEKASEEEIRGEVKALTYRHIAWMNALRFSMRTRKSWETVAQERTNQEWNVLPPEATSSLDDNLKPYLSDSDMDYVNKMDNKQTALLYLQSHHLRRLKEKGLIWEFSFLELEAVIQTLFDHQGKSERIKNFPYPRHFATLNHYFMWVFILILPLAGIPQFAEIGVDISAQHPLVGDLFLWLFVPFYGIVAWVFHTMERIGRTGENPFEGTANDVPISTIARGIEIDLRQNLGENKDEIPAQHEMIYDTQF